MNDELMIRIDDVSKEYRLGQIGGTTIKEEIQRKVAKVKGKEDPTKKIGAKDYEIGEKFLALNKVSFNVKKGERVGIIGHNGAGKSTLLKLISRVTAPTSGDIWLDGRVASMLEVGTGFHPELTGRENIYMNGAILGMTKKEIDAKIEDIIDFSEVRQFIDTPVKRYSSGMYVKLAFSVAAHLDSEIMIMDEVLAVGDVKFQKKCLGKMGDESRKGKTVLYVSHNMATIRQLCDRCIVMERGELIFDGDVEKAIQCYSGNKQGYQFCVDSRFISRRKGLNQRALIKKVEIINSKDGFFSPGSHIRFRVIWDNYKSCDTLIFRIFILNNEGKVVSLSISRSPIKAEQGYSYIHELDLDLLNLVKDDYKVSILLTNYEETRLCDFDILDSILSFTISSGELDPIMPYWNVQSCGQVKLPDLICEQIESKSFNHSGERCV